MPEPDVLVRHLKETGLQLTELQARRRDLARQLVDAVGAAEAARNVGVPRQTLVDWLGRDWSRKTEPPLLRLIRAGALQAGEQLIINRRRQPSATATLDRDGRIVFEGETFDAPSGAARKVLQSGPQDGWLRFRVPRLDGITLAQVRDSLTAE